MPVKKSNEEKTIIDIDYYLMSFAKFTSVTQTLQHLNKTVPELYEKYSNSEKERFFKEMEGKITLEDVGQIDNLVSFFSSSNPSQVIKKCRELSSNAFSSMDELIRLYSYQNSIGPFFRKMSIVYLIAEFEEFLKRMLTLSYVNKPESLKSEKQISFQEIIELNNFEKIFLKLISKNTKEIIDKNPEDLASTLTEFFKIDSKDANIWNDIKEVFYRRHVLIHNNDNADDWYRLKTGNINAKNLSPTQEYVNNSIKLFLNSANKICQIATKKFPQNIEQIQRFSKKELYL